MRLFKFMLGSFGLFALAGTLLVGAQGIKPRQPETPPQVAAPEAGKDRARDLYYLADKSGEIRYTGLRLKLYQADANCNFMQVSPFKAFRAGEALRFAVESNTAGFVYIIARGSSGQTRLLYPHPDVNNGANHIHRGTELMIPGREWFRFDHNPGVETISVILTRRKLDLLPYLIPSAPTAEPAPASGGIEAAVLELLQGGAKARDLVLTPDDAPAPVVATSGVYANGYYAVNTLKTGNEYCVLQFKLNHQ
jgi:hypothetical protein